MAITKVNFTSNTAWDTQKQINDNFSELDTNKADLSDIPTKTSDLENDSNFITRSETEGLGGKIDSISVNGNPQIIQNKNVNIIVPVTATDVGALSDTTKYGANIDLSMDSDTYVITIQLKDQNGNNLGTAKTIDLPLESVVVSGSYDSENKKVVLTLKDGSTVEFSVADLVSGLQSEITSSNKLASDLVDDTNQVHKFVTQNQINTWNNKPSSADLDELSNDIGRVEDKVNAKQDKIASLSFTVSDANWSDLDSNGFYTLSIESTKTPVAVYNSNKEQVMAGLKSDGTNVYVITDTKFAGSVSVY